MTGRIEEEGYVGILKHIDSIVSGLNVQFRERLRTMEDEIREMRQQQTQLINSVTAFIESDKHHASPCQHLQDALMLDDRGRLDTRGHYTDHKTRREGAAEMGRLRFQIVAAVVIAGTIGLGGWILTAAKQSAMEDVVAAIAKEHLKAQANGATNGKPQTQGTP